MTVSVCGCVGKGGEEEGCVCGVEDGERWLSGER